MMKKITLSAAARYNRDAPTASENFVLARQASELSGAELSAVRAIARAARDDGTAKRGFCDRK